MADSQKSIEQEPTYFKANGIGYTERPIHNVETWKRLGLLSEEIYLQLTIPSKENRPKRSGMILEAVDKLGDFIIAGLNFTGDGIILFGETLRNNHSLKSKSKNITRKR
jgi:hypothetical protein